MDRLFAWFCHNMNTAIHALCQVLPQSPFSRFIDLAERVPILGLLNYFVPITAFLDITFAWADIITLRP